jgi:hypothetical protein
LGFEQTVDSARLLLFTQLQAVTDQFSLAILAMLAGNEVALFDRAFLRMAAFTLQKQFHALAPALPANRADISCQVFLLTFPSGAVYSLWQAFFPLTQARRAETPRLA